MTLTTKEPGTPDVVDAGAPRTHRRPVAGKTPGNSGQILRLLAALALLTVVFVVAGLGDLLLFIFIIVLIVMLHELAHFATAKWCGMKVTEYFVGFGPRLWSFRRGETEYGVKAIPAGGYVKITGFTSLEDVDPEDEPRTYRQQAFWKRIVVASAGSVMHFIIAFVLALIVAFSWGVPTNNQAIQKFDHWVGVAHTPAQLAGLRTGDVIVSFNGHSLSGPNTLQTDLKGAKVGQPVTLGVDRGGRLLHVSVTPRSGKGLRDSLGALQNRSYIGVNLAPANTSENPLQAIKTATFNIGSYTKQEVLGTGRLFSASGLSSFYDQVTNPKAAAKASANPITDNRPLSLVGIASLGVHDQQQGGFQSLFILLILVNIIFGLLNMLPMIPLDGGHVAVAAYEWIRTKKGQAFYRADITKMFPVVAVFLAFLMVITISAVYLDITHPLQIH